MAHVRSPNMRSCAQLSQIELIYVQIDKSLHTLIAPHTAFWIKVQKNCGLFSL